MDRSGLGNKWKEQMHSLGVSFNSNISQEAQIVLKTMGGRVQFWLLHQF